MHFHPLTVGDAEETEHVFNCSAQTDNLVNISQGSIDHGFIILTNMNGCDSRTIVDIPKNAWVGLFLSGYVVPGELKIQAHSVKFESVDKPVYSNFFREKDDGISIVMGGVATSARVEFIGKREDCVSL